MGPTGSTPRPAPQPHQHSNKERPIMNRPSHNPTRIAGGRASLDDDMVHAATQMAREQLASLPQRWAHTCGVAAAARTLSRRLAPAGRAAVIASAWLHDIGYSPELALIGFHPLDGARHLRTARFHPVVVSLVAHHSGADSEAAERGLLAELTGVPLPVPPDPRRAHHRRSEHQPARRTRRARGAHR